MDIEEIEEKFRKVYYEDFISNCLPKIGEAAILCGYNKREICILMDGVTGTLHMLFGKTFDEIDRDIQVEFMLKADFKDKDAI